MSVDPTSKPTESAETVPAAEEAPTPEATSTPATGPEATASSAAPEAAPAPAPAPSPPPAPAPAAAPSPAPTQTSMASRGLSYAVDIVFCVDVTGSMTPIIDQVKANALRFYDDVQTNLTDKGKNVDQLRVRVLAFRDFQADGSAAMQESPFFALPADRAGFSDFVNGPDR